MGADHRDAYGFTLVAIGLLTGFFLGAGLVYLYTNREVTDMFAERTLERIGRVFAYGQEDEAGHDEDHQLLTDHTNGLSDRIHVPGEPDAQKAEQIQRAGQMPESAPDQASAGNILALTDQGAEGVSEQVLSLHDDGSDDEDHHFTEGIRISRDRLLGIKGFILPFDDNDSPDSEGSRKLDSLMGGKQQNQGAKRLMYVEFWESPLNYSVYKLARNRLIVYGIDQIDQVNLLSHEGALFLKYNEQYFTLEHASDFRLLLPESSVERIRKLDYSWP